MPQPTIEDYFKLREELQRLKAEAIPNQAAIDQVIEQLEEVQLQIKGGDGQRGNNPLD